MFFTDETTGRKIYYETHGEGPTIILLHHGFASSKMWQLIRPPLVAAGFQVVVYDRAGYGRSEPGTGYAEFYTGDTFRRGSVRELNRLVAHLGLTAFHLVGQCEGGVVAVDYAVAFSGQVKTLVSSSTLCHSRVAMVAFNRDKFPWTFAELGTEMRDKLVSWHGADYAETLYERCRRFGGAYGREKFDLRPVLEKVTCPALVLYPDRSSLFEVEQGVEFYRHLPVGELAVLPYCGHNTYEHQPEEYVRQILGFINRHQAADNSENRAEG